MIYPLLYKEENSATGEKSLLGGLTDALSLLVTEEINGEYEILLRYPCNGVWSDHISNSTLIECVTTPELTSTDLFRPYSIDSTINGQLTIRAKHISYDLSKVIIPRRGSSFAVRGIVNYITRDGAGRDAFVGAHPFEITTTMENDESVLITIPNAMSIRHLMMGAPSNIVSVFGGEWEFDNYNAILHSERGVNRGAIVQYAVNMSSFNSSLRTDQTYVVACGLYNNVNEDGIVVELLTRAYDPAAENFYSSWDTPTVKLVDLTDEFDEEPTLSQLESKTVDYCYNHYFEIFEPSLSIDVGVIDLSQTSEQTKAVPIELGDTVKVVNPLYGFSYSARCTKTVFNALTNKYEKAVISTPQKNIAKTIANQQLQLNKLLRR